MRTYPDLDEKVYWDTLPGGLTIAVVPRPGFQKKLAYFVTNYGSIHTGYSIDGKPYQAPDGVAHFLEHKMFDLPRGEVSAEFAAMGASPNAFTSYDMTAYYFSCTEHFDENLRLLLEFVSTPYFTKESVAKEQGIIGQEIQMSSDNPDHRVFEDLMEAMYSQHNIRIPILGSKESIAQITPQILNDCHRAFYRQDNMILCVVGDVDPDAVRQAAMEILPAADEHKVEKLLAVDTDMTCLRSYSSRHMEVAMPTFQLGFKSEYVPGGEAAMRQEMVADLAAEALFGESSALYLKLYEEGLIDGSFGGGYAEDFGSAQNLLLGTITLCVCLFWNIIAKGYLRQLSVLVGLIAGYIVAIFMGKVDLSIIFSEGLIALPKLLPYTPEFHVGAIFSVAIIFRRNFRFSELRWLCLLHFCAVWLPSRDLLLSECRPD